MSLHKIKPSLRWSSDQRPLVAQIVVSCLGLAGPIAIGALSGQLGAGMAAGLGGLAMTSTGSESTVKRQAIGIVRDVVVTGAGFSAGLYLSAMPLLLMAVLLTAAQLSSSTRSMVRQMTLFIIFALIANGLSAQNHHPGAVLIFFMTGMACSGLLWLIISPLFRLAGIDPPLPVAAPDSASAHGQHRHWMRSMRNFTGWQYTVRLAGCMALGTLAGHYFVPTHTYWVLLTIVLVQDRQLPASMRKTFDRGAGTVIGVLLASPLLATVLPASMMIAMIFLLAAARPIFKSANYLAYSAIMTPLIMLLMSLGHEGHLRATLSDRVLATLIACLLVLVSDRFFWPRFARNAHQQPTSPH